MLHNGSFRHLRCSGVALTPKQVEWLEKLKRLTEDNANPEEISAHLESDPFPDGTKIKEIIHKTLISAYLGAAEIRKNIC